MVTLIGGSYNSQGVATIVSVKRLFHQLLKNTKVKQMAYAGMAANARAVKYVEQVTVQQASTAMPQPRGHINTMKWT